MYLSSLSLIPSSEQGFSLDKLVLKLADVYERKAFAELLKLILPKSSHHLSENKECCFAA